MQRQVPFTYTFKSLQIFFHIISPFIGIKLISFIPTFVYLSDLMFARTILHLEHMGLPRFSSSFFSDDDVTKLVQNDTPLKTYGGPADF